MVEKAVADHRQAERAAAAEREERERAAQFAAREAARARKRLRYEEAARA